MPFYAQEASTAELWNTINFYYRPESQARSCCGKLTSYFSSHCPQFLHMDKWISNTPCLGQDWATPQTQSRERTQFPFLLQLLATLSWFGALTVQILFPEWFIFFLWLNPITITIQFVNALRRSFSPLPSGHQRNQTTSHQNPKKSHGFIFQRSRDFHWGGRGSTPDSMLTNLVTDTPQPCSSGHFLTSQCHRLLLL